mgnify:CR=1 FL=1
MRACAQAALGLLLLVGCTATAAVPGVAPGEAPADAEDEDCRSACERPAVDEGPSPPTAAEFAALVSDWLAEPVDAPSLPLETLLYHGEHSRRLLARLPREALSDERRSFLLYELDRGRAAIEVRLVDESGAVRGELQASGLQLGVPSHQHLHATGSLGDVELSGRVRRVGLHHLWSRW